MLKSISILTLLFLSECCLADGTATKTVGQIEVRGDLVLISAADENGWNSSESCLAGNGEKSIALQKSHASFSEIYSGILAARMAGKEISFWTSGCHTWSSHSYPKLSVLYIRGE